jgi:integrase
LPETSGKASRGVFLDNATPIFRTAAEVLVRSTMDRWALQVADLRGRLGKHIPTQIGAVGLDRITVGVSEKMRDDMRAGGYVLRIINTIIRIVGAVFRAAIRRGDAVSNSVDRVKRAFKVALPGAGLCRVNMHLLRHGFGSALIMRGAAVTQVQSLLGNASPAITLRIYSYWFQTVDSGAVERLSELIRGNGGGIVCTGAALRSVECS